MKQGKWQSKVRTFMENEIDESNIQDSSKISRHAVISLSLAIISPLILILAVLPSHNSPIITISLLFPPIMSLLAIDYGFISFKKIKASQGKLKGKSLAIVSSIIGFLVFLLLIFGIYLPALGKVKYIGWRMTCGNRISEIGKAMLIYVNDYDGFPTPEKWCDLLIEKCNVSANHFRCPDAQKGPCNYALNKNIAVLGTTADPNIVVLFETHPGWNQVGGPEILTAENHKGKGCNIVFLDSHVEFVETKNIDKLKWKPD